MPTYLVERYAPGPHAAASIAGTSGDHRVRHLQSTLIPADEIALCLFEAPSKRALERALAAGGCSFVRVVEALVRGPGDCPGALAGSERPDTRPRESIQGGMT